MKLATASLILALIAMPAGAKDGAEHPEAAHVTCYSGAKVVFEEDVEVARVASRGAYTSVWRKEGGPQVVLLFPCITEFKWKKG